MPLVRPVTVASRRDAPTWTGVCATPPMYGVTGSPVIGLSPSDAGAVQLTRADWDAGARDDVGAAGATAVRGVTGLDAAEAGAGRSGLSAWTVNVYVVPVVSPVIVVVVAGGEPVIVFGVWAVEPMYGVIRYEVTARRRSWRRPGHVGGGDPARMAVTFGHRPRAPASA